MWSLGGDNASLSPAHRVHFDPHRLCLTDTSGSVFTVDIIIIIFSISRAQLGVLKMYSDQAVIFDCYPSLGAVALRHFLISEDLSMMTDFRSGLYVLSMSINFRLLCSE